MTTTAPTKPYSDHCAPVRWLLRKQFSFELDRAYGWSRSQALWRTIRGGPRLLAPPGYKWPHLNQPPS